MTNPRPEVVHELESLSARLECTKTELRAAIRDMKQPTRKRRPKSELYERLGWGMFALVAIHGQKPFTAAKLLLHLSNKPVHQRANQAKALVRRFDASCREGEIVKCREYYAQRSADELVREFQDFWQHTGLPSLHEPSAGAVRT